MPSASTLTSFTSRTPTLFLRSLTLFSIETLANLLLWIATLIIATPLSSNNFASLALIAWTSGLRHALDADHICAIDNATRRIVGVRKVSKDVRQTPITWKSMVLFWQRIPPQSEPAADLGCPTLPSEQSSTSLQRQAIHQRPLLVGFWFSLGHSTVVIVVTVAVSISLEVATRLDGFGSVGNIVGPAIAGSFLFLVALGNSIMLARAWKARKRMHIEERIRKNARSTNSDVEYGVTSPSFAEESKQDGDRGRFMGLLTRLTLPLLKAVTRPYHMYLVGVLFGLGFDTASTIALLSVSASAGLATGSNAKVILLALLFTAGMTWVDCCDSILMVWAYAPPEEGQAGGKGSKRWWALFEEEKSSCLRGEAKQRRDEEEEQDDEKPVTINDASRVDEPSVGKKVEMQSLSQALEDQDGIAELCKEMPTDREAKISEVGPTHHLPCTTSPIPLATLSSSAQSLSHLLTLLSILLALTISILVLMGLIASECSSCSRSLELHKNPETNLRLVGEQDNVIAEVVVVNDGGVAGQWWNFWDKANEHSGYIGAGIVACFLILTVVWWSIQRVLRRRRNRRQGSIGAEEEQESPPQKP